MFISIPGNAGCRLDAEEATRVLLPMEISVVAFDFAGSGNSEGDVRADRIPIRSFVVMKVAKFDSRLVRFVGIFRTRRFGGRS